MPASEVDYRDIQGIVRFGYGSLTEACFLLVRIRDAAAARRWLAGAPVTNAVKRDKAPNTALQIAFTVAGLRAIGVGEDLIAGFSNEFLSGIATDESRSRRLGDLGPNAPTAWDWGGSDATTPHLVLMLYSVPDRLDAWHQDIHGSHWNEAFYTGTCLTASNMKGFEPFGFKDGISQPTLDWEQIRDTSGDTMEYTNRVALGEFLLGYSNEYDRYTDRPLLPRQTAIAAASTLSPAKDQPSLLDFGRNGSYIVFRHLEQDVRAFWQFAHRAAAGDPDEIERITSAMVGRHITGEPVVALEPKPIDGIELRDALVNNFNYASDEMGLSCPLGSHIRRANPRTADMPAGTTGTIKKLLRTIGLPQQTLRQDTISSTRFHRLLRRGREYGQAISPEDAITPAPAGEKPCGIFFLCLNANIARQFEFVQSSWMMNANFDGLPEESDPLLGPRCPLFGGEPTASFSMPKESGLRQKAEDMPRFVTVRGGAYLFLPSISALRFIAQSGD
jgi:deferrochelatase/peroxidase EfeB